MEQNKIYYVYDTSGDFFMIGRCLLSDNGGSDSHHTRGDANYITRNNSYHNEQSWSYKSKNREYREASLEEQQWFLECERQEKFIPKEQIKFNYEIY